VGEAPEHGASNDGEGASVKSMLVPIIVSAITDAMPNGLVIGRAQR
jgi:hypothetical protein